MANILPSIIHTNQAGFVKHRHVSDPVQKMSNTVYYGKLSRNPHVIASLDVHKAFDKICWSYLYLLFSKINFDDSFMFAFQHLYTNSKAVVWANGQDSSTLDVQRGSKQSCPLSLLLFMLAIEPLANTLQKSNKINYIRCNGQSYPLNLFADDIAWLSLIQRCHWRRPLGK